MTPIRVRPGSASSASTARGRRPGAGKGAPSIPAQRCLTSTTSIGGGVLAVRTASRPTGHPIQQRESHGRSRGPAKLTKRSCRPTPAGARARLTLAAVPGKGSITARPDHRQASSRMPISMTGRLHSARGVLVGASWSWSSVLDMATLAPEPRRLGRDAEGQWVRRRLSPKWTQSVNFPREEEAAV